MQLFPCPIINQTSQTVNYPSGSVVLFHGPAAVRACFYIGNFYFGESLRGINEVAGDCVGFFLQKKSRSLNPYIGQLIYNARLDDDPDLFTEIRRANQRMAISRESVITFLGVPSVISVYASVLRNSDYVIATGTPFSSQVNITISKARNLASQSSVVEIPPVPSRFPATSRFGS